jgi:hypothetical protein
MENAILDMGVIVRPRARVGQTHRHAPTLRASSPDQVTIVAQDSRIPEGGAVEADL